MSKKKKSGYMRVHRMLSGLVRFFLRVHIKGIENIPMEGGMVVCANHISLTDPVGIAAAFPRQLTFLAKAELFRIPILRSLIRAFGAHPLDRRGDISAMKKAISMAAEGAPVLIFPQGTRHQGKNPRDTAIKSGAGMIAMRAGAPIIPIYIDGPYRLFRKVDVRIGKPVDISDLGRRADTNTLNEITKRLETAIWSMRDAK
jgi:1-acyl-sn-glycerol-3-phosphate acyltransferase